MGKYIKFPKITFWRVVLAIILIMAFYVAVVRFTKGLGVSTNLSDNSPWGLWIAFDVMVGVGLAAGGFVIAGAVYIFGFKSLKPIVRPTVLTAFLGYVFVAVGLLFDLGRPYRIWHPILMRNPHSVMLEVAWCVMLYLSVLFLEFSPAALEHFNLKTPLKLFKYITIPLVVLGVILSTLHQSSLGSLFLIVPDKLHGLWYSSFLPVFFLISAVGAGLAMTIFESFMSSRAFKRGLELKLLSDIGRVIIVVLLLYFLMKFIDLSKSGNLSLIFEGSRESTLFLAEIGLGVLLPIVLLAIPKVRNNETGLFFSSLFVILGFIMNRLNVGITGIQRGMGASYFPSWMEFVVTISLVAAGFTIFALAAKYLPVFPTEEEHERIVAPPRPTAAEPTLASRTGIAVLIGLIILTGAGLIFLYASENNKTQDVVPAEETSLPITKAVPTLHLPDDYLFPQAEDSPGKVIFSHESHVDSDEPNCKICHSGLFKMFDPGMSATGYVSMKQMYEGKQCGVCHNGKEAFDVNEDCEICHELSE